MQSYITRSLDSKTVPVVESRFQFNAKNESGAMLCIAVYVCMVVLLAVMCICVLLAGFGTAEWSVGMMARNALLLPIIPLAGMEFLHLLVAGCTAYRFDADALVQKRPFRPEKRIPWTDLRQVCVCQIKPRKGGAYPVIYFVRHEGKPFTGGIQIHPDGRWGMGRRGVIRIDCREDILAGLMRRCPLPIEDLRRNRHEQRQ